MLIPSIDLMGGKIVQLVQGDRKALEFDNFEYWVDRFASYPMVQLIDLDAAMGKGSNEALVAQFCERLPCQVGGGIRSVEAVHRMFRAGAKKVIVGSALLKDGAVNLEAAQQFAHAAAAERADRCRRCARRQGQHPRLETGNRSHPRADDARNRSPTAEASSTPTSIPKG